STWKHGMFEHADPDSSAFSSVESDDKGNFVTVPAATGNGREASYVTRLFGSARAYPYHPDPLITRIRVWAMRRFHEKSTEGIFVGEGGMPMGVVFDLYGGRRWPNARALKIEVTGVERTTGQSLFSLKEGDNVLKVRVPEGERMTLVLVPEGDDS